MAWKYNPFTDALDQTGSGGGTSYIDGDVEYHSNLPVTVGAPAVNSAFLVRKGEGLYFVSRKPAGIWVRELNNGNLDDWKYAGTFSDLYRDANFRILNNTDITKELAFDVSGVTTGTTRTLTVPNASGTIALTSGTTFTNLSAAPTSGSALTLTGGTVTASAPLIDATQTWNDAAVAFRALRVNVTNTASTSASLLADFQVGGSNVFSINRAGALGVGGAAWLAFGSAFGSAAAMSGVWSIGGAAFNLQSSLGVNYGVIQLGSNMSMGWSSNTAPAAASADLRLFRDAADTLAQYRGTNAQTFRIYNTFTDASNYERGFMRWSSNILQIGSEKLGTGSARSLQFVIDGVNMLEFQAGGSILANRSIATTGGYGITSDLHFTLQAATGQLRWGSTSSVPMLKRSSAIIQARLGDDSAYTTIDAQHRLQGTAPATAGATGTAGDIRYDADYIYVCTAASTWKRAAIATW